MQDTSSCFSYFRVTAVLTAIFLISSWITTAFIAYNNKHNPRYDMCTLCTDSNRMAATCSIMPKCLYASKRPLVACRFYKTMPTMTTLISINEKCLNTEA